MEKNTNRFIGKSLMMLLVAGFFVAGCSNADYNKEGETNTANEMDSIMVNHDTAMNSGNMTMMDSSATVGANGEKVAAAKPGASKTVKKGKVTIVAAPADKNTAMDVDKEGYYRNTEVLPAFPGGQKALERFFEDNIQYPEAATENDAQGVVTLTFAVDENGKIFQPQPVGNKIGYGIEEEAVRVFNKMPRWTPGKIKGKNVKTRFTLPINFQLY